MMQQQEITIIGGGIAGLTTAVALKRIGINVQVFEAAPAIEPLGAGLGLGLNAIKAFEAMGLKAELLAQGHSLKGFSILDHRGRTIMESKPSTDPAMNFTIARAELHALLLAQLEPGTVHLNKRLKDLKRTKHGVELTFADGSGHHASYVLAAEGVRSRVRTHLLPGSQPRYAGYTAWRGIVHAPHLHLERSTETWGPRGRFGIVPLSKQRIYWFATVNAPQNDPRCRNFRMRDLMENFKGYHDPMRELLSLTQDPQLLWNDILDIAPLMRFAYDRILLIGDAAHATTPNLGQGACQAIEDAVVLANCIMKTNTIEDAFVAFEKARLARTRWITETSWRFGKLAQLQSPLWASLRNGLLRMTPASVNERQMKRLFEVHFDRLHPRVAAVNDQRSAFAT